MGWLMFVVVLGSSIWVLVDAQSLGAGKLDPQKVVPAKFRLSSNPDPGPGAWFFGCLLLWIVVFPMYLLQRPNLKAAGFAPTSNAGNAGHHNLPPPPPRASAPPPPAAPAGWMADPTGKHEHRYWDGRAWTSNVADQGRTSVDPL